MMSKKRINTNRVLEHQFQSRVQPLVKDAPWLLRITEHKDKPAPVFVVKERFAPDEGASLNGGAPKKVLRERGLIYGQSLRRCLPVIKTIIGGVCDDAEIPLELHRFLGDGRIAFRGNLPLDEEAGLKLSLIFKLQGHLRDMNRVELIACRVERFSREEAAYWLTRITQYGGAASRWARSGMRVILGGQPGDKEALRMLEKLRR